MHEKSPNSAQETDFHVSRGASTINEVAVLKSAPPSSDQGSVTMSFDAYNKLCNAALVCIGLSAVLERLFEKTEDDGDEALVTTAGVINDNARLIWNIAQFGGATNEQR